MLLASAEILINQAQTLLASGEVEKTILPKPAAVLMGWDDAKVLIYATLATVFVIGVFSRPLKVRYPWCVVLIYALNLFVMEELAFMERAAGRRFAEVDPVELLLAAAVSTLVFAPHAERIIGVVDRVSGGWLDMWGQKIGMVNGSGAVQPGASALAPSSLQKGEWPIAAPNHTGGKPPERT